MLSQYFFCASKVYPARNPIRWTYMGVYRWDCYFPSCTWIHHMDGSTTPTQVAIDLLIYHSRFEVESMSLVEPISMVEPRLDILHGLEDVICLNHIDRCDQFESHRKMWSIWITEVAVINMNHLDSWIIYFYNQLMSIVQRACNSYYTKTYI